MELRLGADLLVEDLGRLEDGGAPSDQVLSVGVGACELLGWPGGFDGRPMLSGTGLLAATAYGEEHRDEGLDPDGEREGHPEALREEEVALRLHLPNEEDAAATAR